VHVLILSVDTASPAGSVAVLRDDQLLGVISTHTDETYSSRIFRQLDFLLTELNLALDRFDLFGVNAGPGSFTGVRVGLTTAKAWGEVFAKPVVPVSCLEAMASQLASGREPIVPVIDARRGQVYAGVYRRSAGSSGETAGLLLSAENAVMSPREFVAWLDNSPELTGAILVTSAARWLSSFMAQHDGVSRNRDIRIREVSPVLAPAIGRLAYTKAQHGETVDALRLDANYVRRCDAEVNWKGK
jgi:tRNA threonylcarbamoyladenosine biosynthesis protein TsaB